MGDLDKNIYRKETASPYEKIIVHPVEKDRKEKESYTTFKETSHFQLYAILFSFLKKTLSPFFKEKSPFIFDAQRLMDGILAFRKKLEILSLEDQSHNPEFTQQLSESWHRILEDCHSLSLSPGASEILTKVNFFVSQIHHFPLGADHTLGYYFAEYAGKDWIPFPFMELLQDLHKEHHLSPATSTLNNWLILLNEILESAK
jgi:hypothetical protein